MQNLLYFNFLCFSILASIIEVYIMYDGCTCSVTLIFFYIVTHSGI